MDYFEYCQFYPSDPLDDLLPPGEIWEYISSTFLNGFINYVKIEDAYVINRYSSWVEVQENYTRWLEEDPYHTRLNVFDDDVIVLAQTEKYYWFFYFDHDVSDCCIGRFEKEDHKEVEVKNLFFEYVKSVSKEERFLKIPTTKIKGWVSF
jgi:hypothetical protein